MDVLKSVPGTVTLQVSSFNRSSVQIYLYVYRYYWEKTLAQLQCMMEPGQNGEGARTYLKPRDPKRLHTYPTYMHINTYIDTGRQTNRKM